MKPIILGCHGSDLLQEEKELFKHHNPVGFILFQRNCVSKYQVKKLVNDLRCAVGRDDAPVLIDQEGGSVARLKSPEWQEFLSAKIFGLLADQNKNHALDAAQINSLLMAQEMREIGVTVNCAPVVDVPSEHCHDFLSGSRTYHRNPEMITDLGEAVCRGLLEGGILPVIKHIPGHGRATVDSHKKLPRVDCGFETLQKTDFIPFKALSKKEFGAGIWAMAAHVIYSALDSDLAASVSSKITNDIIRGEIGFKGVLLADDISMEALSGTLAERALATLEAGMDLTMHCNGEFDEMNEILSVLPNITDVALNRVNVAEALRKKYSQNYDGEVLQKKMKKLADLMEERNVA